MGLRNPKPDQLEKIASALGLNVSVFLDFNIETVGDVLSLLFAIDDAVDLSLKNVDKDNNHVNSIEFTFANPTLQEFVKKWCEFKTVYERDKAAILTIKDEKIKLEKLEELEKTHEEWKLRAMGTSIGCHNIVKKGTDGISIKINDLT